LYTQEGPARGVPSSLSTGAVDLDACVELFPRSLEKLARMYWFNAGREATVSARELPKMPQNPIATESSMQHVSRNFNDSTRYTIRVMSKLTRRIIIMHQDATKHKDSYTGHDDRQESKAEKYVQIYLFRPCHSQFGDDEKRGYDRE